MNEIAMCPICGKDVKQSIWRPEYEGCGGSIVVTIKCCGIEAVTIPLWNQYAAAMEFVRAAIWADECEAQKDHMDDTTSNLDAWRSIVNLDIEADNKACDAFERAIEVFGGE